MKNKRKICLCLAVPLISFAILYGGGYAAQFIKNYKNRWAGATASVPDKERNFVYSNKGTAAHRLYERK
ncbi:MAG: hypothetical protein ACLR56_11285 [Oscillospiraceae bacterium]